MRDVAAGRTRLCIDGGIVGFVDQHDSLWQLLNDVASDEGLSLYDAERKGQLLRVTITRRDDLTSGPQQVADVDGAQEIASDELNASAANGGVTSGDCSRLCRRLMVLFRAEGPKYGVGEEPEIDVSSPGINRELRLERHFVEAIGQRVKVVLTEEALCGRRSPVLIGTLRSVAGQTGAPHGDPNVNTNQSAGGADVALEGKAPETAELAVEDEHSGELHVFRLRDVKRAHVDYKF